MRALLVEDLDCIDLDTRNRHLREPLSEVQMYKSLQCFLYQCARGMLTKSRCAKPFRPFGNCWPRSSMKTRRNTKRQSGDKIPETGAAPRTGPLAFQGAYSFSLQSGYPVQPQKSYPPLPGFTLWTIGLPHLGQTFPVALRKAVSSPWSWS